MAQIWPSAARAWTQARAQVDFPEADTATVTMHFMEAPSLPWLDAQPSFHAKRAAGKRGRALAWKIGPSEDRSKRSAHDPTHTGKAHAQYHPKLCIAEREQAGDPGGVVTQWLASLTAGFWTKKPSCSGIAGLGAALVYCAYAMWRHDWVMPIDNVTLLIHEAGHPALGILSDRLMVYGGTIFQLLFPCLFCRHFLKEDNALGFVFGLGWLSTALHAMGVYVADARAQALPLVGSGDRIHDWADILGRWGLLAWDGKLGGLLGLLSWFALGAALLLLWNLWRAPRAE